MKKNWCIIDLSRSNSNNNLGSYAFVELTEEEEEKLPYQDDSIIEVIWNASEIADEELAREEARIDGYPVDSMYTVYDINVLLN